MPPILEMYGMEYHAEWLEIVREHDFETGSNF
jgi:hypothetical protein